MPPEQIDRAVGALLALALDLAVAVQRLAALEVPKSLRRPHAVIAAYVVDHASRVADSKCDKSSWAFPHSQGSY